jgi:replication factor C subunit 3/5
MIPIYKNVSERLDAFYNSNKIPHIIFHGPSGSGKRTIVHDFIQKIYNNNKEKIKSNVMHVNCAHGKGIKFIRDELSILG